MGIIGSIISLAIVGLIIGALGRLVVPGPNRIGIWATIGIGIIGAFLGAIIGGLIGLGFISIIFEVAISAGLVYAISGPNRRRRISSGRW